MTSLIEARREQLLLLGASSLLAVWLGTDLLGAGRWPLVGVVSLFVFVLGGPCRWIARDRLSPQQRARIDSAVSVAVLVALVVGLPLTTLAFARPGFSGSFVDVFALGGLVGYLAVAGLETTVV